MLNFAFHASRTSSQSVASSKAAAVSTVAARRTVRSQLPCRWAKARIARSVWASGTPRADLLRSLPLLLLFVCAWGFGETVGAWVGPGNALSRVK